MYKFMFIFLSLTYSLTACSHPVVVPIPNACQDKKLVQSFNSWRILNVREPKDLSYIIKQCNLKYPTNDNAYRHCVNLETK
jgi:hypothetical protein